MRGSTGLYDTPYTLDKNPTNTHSHLAIVFDGKRYNLPSVKDGGVLIVFLILMRSSSIRTLFSQH